MYLILQKNLTFIIQIMILVTGATGNLGARVVEQLLKVGANHRSVVSSSNHNGVEALQAKGLNARLANFSDVSSLNESFKGIDKLLKSRSYRS